MDAAKQFIGQTFKFNNDSEYHYDGVWKIVDIWKRGDGLSKIKYKLLSNTLETWSDTYIKSMKDIEKEMGITFTRASKLSLMISTIQESLL